MRLILWISIMVAAMIGCTNDRGNGRADEIVQAPDLTMRNSSPIYLTAASMVSGSIVEDFGVLGQNGGSATIGFAMITRNPVFDVIWQEGYSAPKQRVSFDLSEFLKTYNGVISRLECEYRGAGVWHMNVYGPVDQKTRDRDLVRTFKAQLPRESK